MSDFVASLKIAHKYHPVAAKVMETNHGGQVVCRDYECNDRGVDAIWNRGDTFPQTIDFKIVFRGFRGDVPLEYESKGQPGCIVDPAKICDVFAFYWVRKRELLLYSASRLRAAATDNRVDWLRLYRHNCTSLGTVMAFVPRHVVEAAISPDRLIYGKGGGHGI